MGLIDDFASMVEGYPVNKCVTEIVEFVIAGNQQRLDVGDFFQFKVKIQNNGNLDMRNVKVEVIGTEYALVGLWPIRGVPNFWRFSQISPQIFNVDAGHPSNSYTTDWFSGKAIKTTDGGKDIVKARIYSWDASLDHILYGHTNVGPECILNKEITQP